MTGSVTFKRKTIFFAGVVLYFFASMNKVLVPGTIYGELQETFRFDAGEMAALGAAFMYSYAASQFLLGIFSDRYGGGRLLLGGAAAFAVGAILSPAASNYFVLLAARALVGFGAGTCYVGVAKLTTELYGENFLWMMTGVLVVGFLGPVTGGAPMARVAEAVSWRGMLAVSAVGAVAAGTVIVIGSFRALNPVVSGNRLKALAALFRKKSNLALFGAAAVLSGAHYTLTALIGKKCLQDTGVFTSFQAANWITLMLAVVAIDNIAGNLLLALFRGRRKVLMLFASATGVAGCAMCLAYFSLSLPWQILAAGFILIAVPAGFFPVFCAIARELNPPENVGMALAMLNFICFAVIAVEQNVTGAILKYHERFYPCTGGAYDAVAYRGVFWALAAFSLVGFFASFALPETRHTK